MSDSRERFLALVEEDPDIKPLAPIIRVILETPSNSLASFLALADLWSKLRGDRRALLVMTLDDSLTVEEIAKLARVHRRTLYKSPLFTRARSRIRAGTPGSLPRGMKSYDDSDCDFDAWDEE